MDHFDPTNIDELIGYLGQDDGTNDQIHGAANIVGSPSYDPSILEDFAFEEFMQDQVAPALQTRVNEPSGNAEWEGSSDLTGVDLGKIASPMNCIENNLVALPNPLEQIAAPASNEDALYEIPPAGHTMQPDPSGYMGPNQNLYLNRILDSFPDARTPLKIIDVVQYPFEKVLQEALERELERQNQAPDMQLTQQDMDDCIKSKSAERARKRSRSQRSPDRRSPRSPARSVLKAKFTGVKKKQNKRPLNIMNFDATEYYKVESTRTAPWGTIDKVTGEHLFRYTNFGELEPASTFTPEQISEYIGQHPLNLIGQPASDAKNSGLTLWIQTVPADSSRRYPNKNSEKCRFNCCPDPKRTIRKGMFRVCFDEQFYQHGGKTDPYHNAGYVHLFCLEKFLDFPQICKVFNVKPDTRRLLEGKNKMAITRDHLSMEDVAQRYIDKSIPWAEFQDGFRPADYYQYTLCYLLTQEHLEQQPQHYQGIREQRGGNTIDRHLNNVDVYVANRKPTRKEGKKRRRANDDDDDNDNILDEGILRRRLSSPREMRAVKRQRTRDSWSGL